MLFLYMVFRKRKKNRNNKLFTIEIEGAMVKRQSQAWINCIVSPSGHTFPKLGASLKELLSFVLFFMACQQTNEGRGNHVLAF